MSVRTSTTYKTLKKDWTIYRIDLEKFTAFIYKQLTCTQEDVDREIRKITKFVTRNDHPSAYVYREEPVDADVSKLIIPVL